MSMFGKAVDACLKHGAEGHFLRYLRECFDEVIACFCRFVVAKRTKIRPYQIYFHTQEDKYTCNPKYICEEFRKRREKGELPADMDFVWRVCNGERNGIPFDCRIVNGGSYSFYQELFASKYIISNSVLYVKHRFRLKKEQIVFETWHGSLGIKRFGKKDYKGGWRWVQAAIATGKMTNYCVTNSTFVSESLRNTYWENTPMLEYGHPRNDIFFDGYKEVREEIRRNFLKAYRLSEEIRFIMYGPTFRDNKNFEVYDIDIGGVLQACEERFGGKWVLLLRYHPSLIDVYNGKGMISDEQNGNAERRVINVTSYTDMQELMTIADIAITDYSSWIYDFMLTRKPGFIFAVDIDLYNNERGLCYPLETTPFPIATKKKQLNELIRNFDENLYKERVQKFLDEKGCVEDGHASERVVDKIVELIMADERK